MGHLQITTTAEQIAAYLLGEIQAGKLSGEMPGVAFLARELDVNHNSVQAALCLLEKQGHLLAQGNGLRRKINSSSNLAGKGFKVAILLWDRQQLWHPEIMGFYQRLKELGHTAVLPEKTLMEMKMNVDRVANLVRKTDADAWVVCIGSYEVVEWFSRQKKPAYAVFGRHHGLPIAATRVNVSATIADTVRVLTRLGHRRIVMLMRRQHRLPKPGPSVTTFFETLEAEGIRTSDYFCPDWEENAEGFRKCLDALFRVTPPTAMIVDEPEFYNATCHYLLSKGLQVPRDVSLIHLEYGQPYEYCTPTVAHFRFDKAATKQHLMRWLRNVIRGKKDIQQKMIRSEFIPGGTIAPPPKQT